MGACSDAKVTVMVLKVDLDCCQCYRKIKRLLCKYPQIKNQVFDEKQNTVTITVVCCSPEKIRDKLCSKGGKSIKDIQIKDSKKPTVDDKGKPMPTPVDKSKPAAADQIQQAADDKQSKPKPAPPQPQADQADKPIKTKPQPSDGGAAEKPNKVATAAADQEKPKPKAAAAEAQDEKGADTAPAPKPADPSKLVGPEGQWVPGFGYPAPVWAPPQVYPVAVYDHGYGYGYGRPSYPPPPGPGPSYYAHSHPYRSDYFTDENATACSIM